MRNSLILTFILTFGVAICAFALDPVTAYVPFDFVVNNSTLPAGNYVFSAKESYNATNIWNMDLHDSWTAISMPAQRKAIPVVATTWKEGTATVPPTMEGATPQPAGDGYCTVVFKKYGSTYFLTKFFVGYTGKEFGESQMERHLRTAGLVANPETVVLAARIR